MLLLAQAFGRALKLAESSTGWLLHALYENQASNFAVPAVLYKSHSVALALGGEEGEGIGKRKRLAGQFQAGGKEAIGGGRGGRREGGKLKKRPGPKKVVRKGVFRTFATAAPPPLLFPPLRTEAIVRGAASMQFRRREGGYCAFVQWGFLAERGVRFFGEER